MSPQRVQLRRTKGWRKPEGAVVVARPSKWGNPLPMRELREDNTREGAYWLAANFYRKWLDGELDHAFLEPRRLAILAAAPTELAGRDLACWCPLDQPCHADVLLEIANARVSEET